MTAIEVGDLVTADLLDLMLNPPICRLVAQSTQPLTDNTQTAIQFGSGSEEIDTDGFHDSVTNNTRITPTVPGIYRFTGAYFMASNANFVTMDANFRKNGTTNYAPGPRRSYSAASVGVSVQAQSVQPSALIEMNGTTDYMELIARQDNSASASISTNASTQFSSVFECKFERPS